MIKDRSLDCILQDVLYFDSKGVKGSDILSKI